MSGDVERGADDIRAPQEPLTHEELEKYVGDLPKAMLDRLPDNTEAREARRLHAVLDELAHDALEKGRSREAPG